MEAGGLVHCSTCLKCFVNFKEYDEHVVQLRCQNPGQGQGKNLSVKFAEICDAIKRKKKIGSGNKAKKAGAAAEEPKQEGISTSKDKARKKEMKSESEEAVELVHEPNGAPKGATKREKSEDEDLDEICVHISGPTFAVSFDAEMEAGAFAKGGGKPEGKREEEVGEREEDYDGEDEGEEDVEEKGLKTEEAGACACAPEPEPGPSWKSGGHGQGKGRISTQTPYMRMFQGASGRVGRVLQFFEEEWDAHKEGAASLPLLPPKTKIGEEAKKVGEERRESKKPIDKLKASYIRSMPGQEYSTPCPFAIGSFVAENGERIWICLACTMEEHAIPTRPMISCDRCDDWYHMDCVGFHGFFARKEPWFCKRCIRDANLE